MRIFRLLKLFGFLAGFSPFFWGGCGGASSPSTPAALPISVEGLDGSTDVATDSSFQYTFTKAVDGTTVDTSTYFIVTTPSADISVGLKAAVDTSICNAASALDASVSCSSSTVCGLDPTSDLSAGTSYTICLITDIDYADGTSFEGFMVTFQTAGTVSCTDASCNDISSLDGASDVAADSTFQYIFSKAVDQSTVTTSTYFIVATPEADISVGIKAAVDTDICDDANALSASVSCNSLTTCELDPDADLSAGTSYTTCLTADIEYLDETSFEGYMVTFVTAETESGTGTATPSSCTAPEVVGFV